ncbi:hypothetical protein C5L38_34135 (plasmid) [Streptomyces sp. WAC00288]|uniref:hypothetical protein n=1 Tax=unclassified Streptomyces TaxID=2593676 RepID=UPI0007899A74|nr:MULTISPECIES: hypothetical protein [unclassified Streptomyces]AVI00107.1 hypothetical protein C5L38_34135 [Streptomyces sp. WAC00288]KYG51171.1 hypothetical protein AWI43_32555 [Streptomyces sp. WAC04657]
MPTTLAPTVRLTAGTHHDEEFDGETLALLDALDVHLPGIDDAMVDLDVYYGTPLELYEPAGTLREMRRYAAAIVSGVKSSYARLAEEAGAEIAARLDAARDIVATDSTVVPLVRERLADLLLPHTGQARLTGLPLPGLAELPAAA